MKKLILISLLLVFSNIFSQTEKAKNIIYLDFGIFFARTIGAVGIGINYERMLNDNISLRAGINYGIFRGGVGDVAVGGAGISLPLTVNFMTNNKNKFEAGIGGGPNINLWDSYSSGIRLLPAVRLGYRYQEDGKGPIYRFGADLPANYYLSTFGIGYHF